MTLKVIGTILLVKKCNCYLFTIPNPEKKQKLLQEIDMMQFERNALYKNGELQRSVMDKAFRLYAPIIKAHYATV